MGGRYIITGVQMGLLQSFDKKKVRKLVQEIFEKQHLFDSKDTLENDLKKLRKKLWRTKNG